MIDYKGFIKNKFVRIAFESILQALLKFGRIYFHAKMKEIVSKSEAKQGRYIRITRLIKNVFQSLILQLLLYKEYGMMKPEITKNISTPSVPISAKVEIKRVNSSEDEV